MSAGTASAAERAILDCIRDPQLIVPGRCVGPITATLRYSDLKHGLPGHSIEPGLSGDDVGLHCVTTMDSGKPAELTIHWSTENQFDETVGMPEAAASAACEHADFADGRAEWVEIGGRVDASDHYLSPSVLGRIPWHTREGLRLGMDWRKVQKVWPENLTIIPWNQGDYSGQIIFTGLLRAYIVYDEKREKLLSELEMKSIKNGDELSRGDLVLTKLDPYLDKFEVVLR